MDNATATATTAKLSVSGDTYEIKERLKANGFSWNKNSQHWEKIVTEKQAKSFAKNMQAAYGGKKDIWVNFNGICILALRKTRANMTAKERREYDEAMEDFHS